MDLHTIRQLLKTKSIYDIPLRVTFYARVSSESDEQLNSLSNQIAYYENKIKQISCWTFVPATLTRVSLASPPRSVRISTE